MVSDAVPITSCHIDGFCELINLTAEVARSELQGRDAETSEAYWSGRLFDSAVDECQGQPGRIFGPWWRTGLLLTMRSHLKACS